MRRVALAGLVAALVLALAGPARAHVTVTPEQADRGSTVAFTFRVPNEKPAASTVRVEIVFPAEHPIPSATPLPAPGWMVSVDMGADGAVAKVAWEGGAIAGGERAEFVVTVGPLPGAADRLVFKALQHYDDGDVVAWIEEPAPGVEDPEHPAPVVQLTGHAPLSTTTTMRTTNTAAPPTTSGVSGPDADDGSRWWAIAAAAAAATAALAVVVVRRRS